MNYATVVRGTAQQLPEYVSEILHGLTQIGARKDRLVIEIGANDGTFLKVLRSAGYTRILGVEPSLELASTAVAAGFEVEPRFFNGPLATELRHRFGPAGLIVCRHTLEHVPQPRDLVQAIGEALGPEGLFCLEVPDHDWVVSQRFAHEIWDEHLWYFRPSSLTRLIEAAGLHVIRLERVRFRDTRNLICWGTKASSERVRHIPIDETTADDLRMFQGRWDELAHRLRERVHSLGGPVIAIGASHIQLNFLNYAGLAATIDLLIDDDPAKAGRYAPLMKPIPSSRQTTRFSGLPEVSCFGRPFRTRLGRHASPRHLTGSHSSTPTELRESSSRVESGRTWSQAGQKPK
jgi:SAM-dependent methyltransferase